MHSDPSESTQEQMRFSPLASVALDLFFRYEFLYRWQVQKSTRVSLFLLQLNLASNLTFKWLNPSFLGHPMLVLQFLFHIVCLSGHKFMMKINCSVGERAALWTGLSVSHPSLQWWVWAQIPGVPMPLPDNEVTCRASAGVSVRVYN